MLGTAANKKEDDKSATPADVHAKNDDKASLNKALGRSSSLVRDDFGDSASPQEGMRQRRIREAFEKCDKHAGADLAFYSRELIALQRSRRTSNFAMTGLLFGMATAAVLAASLPADMLASYGRGVSAAIAVLAVAIVALRSWVESAGFERTIATRRAQFEALTEAQREMELRWKLDVDGGENEASSVQLGQDIVADFSDIISETRRAMDGDIAAVKGYR